MPDGQRDDQFAVKDRQRGRWHDQAAIRLAREYRDVVLDLTSLAHTDGAQLDPQRRRHGLDGSKLGGPTGCGRLSHRSI
jgi:hypothetical protein